MLRNLTKKKVLLFFALAMCMALILGMGIASAASAGTDVYSDPTSIDVGNNQAAGDITIELGNSSEIQPVDIEVTLPHGVTFTHVNQIDITGAMVEGRSDSEISLHSLNFRGSKIEISDIDIDVDTAFRGGVYAMVKVISAGEAELLPVAIAEVEYETSRISVQVATPIDIPDANLKAYLRGVLNIPTGDITDADMANLTFIDASSRNISDITGLEYAVNVTYLKLDGNNISDLTPVANLTKVVYLYASYNDISVIPDLSGMTTLADLSLPGNNITDVSPCDSLKTLANFDFLDLSSNNITDISALANLDGLRYLWLDGNNNISDISVVANFPLLFWLEMGENNISDISALSGLTALETVDLSGNSISVLTPLAGKTAISELDLQENLISDISSLAGLSGLEILYLNDNNLNSADLANLAGLTSLDDLGLSGNAITDLSSLSSLTALTTLGLGENSISNITPLAVLTGLQYLSLHDNSISDITPLADLDALKGLTLYINNISNIGTLSDKTALDYLWLFNNNISDITPLANLSALTTLSLAGNDITAIPALNMPILDTLYLSGNLITDISGLADLTALTYLDLGSNRISDITALADLDAVSWLNLDMNYLHVIDTLLDMSGLEDVDLGYNYLNINPGSPAMDVVDALEDDGVSVILALQYEDPALHTVTYNGNTNTSGTVPVDSSSYQEYDTVTVKANSGNLAKTGYVFAGWNTSANGSGTTYAPGSTFEMGFENVILYAKWSTGSSDVEAFVTRFYQECLDRDPAQIELDYWVDQLESGESTGADVAFGFVYSDEFQSNDLTDEEYLEVLYTAFFNRTPAPSEVAYWVDQLDIGMSRVGVLAGFLEANEFSALCDDYGITPRGDQDVEAFVTRFYLECLSRVPDPAGLADWVDQLESGAKTGADVAYGFVYSTEFQAKILTKDQYVNILYGAFFDRVPDSGGKAYWLGLLNSGTSRLEVLAGFVNSTEFAALCAEYGITPGEIDLP